MSACASARSAGPERPTERQLRSGVSCRVSASYRFRPCGQKLCLEGPRRRVRGQQRLRITTPRIWLRNGGRQVRRRHPHCRWPVALPFAHRHGRIVVRSLAELSGNAEFRDYSDWSGRSGQKHRCGFACRAFGCRIHRSRSALRASSRRHQRVHQPLRVRCLRPRERRNIPSSIARKKGSVRRCAVVRVHDIPPRHPSRVPHGFAETSSRVPRLLCSSRR